MAVRWKGNRPFESLQGSDSLIQPGQLRVQFTNSLGQVHCGNRSNHTPAEGRQTLDTWLVFSNRAKRFSEMASKRATKRGCLQANPGIWSAAYNPEQIRECRVAGYLQSQLQGFQDR